MLSPQPHTTSQHTQYLQSCVHFHKEEVLCVNVHNKLHGAGRPVADSVCGTHCCLANVPVELLGKACSIWWAQSSISKGLLAGRALTGYDSTFGERYAPQPRDTTGPPPLPLGLENAPSPAVVFPRNPTQRSAQQPLVSLSSNPLPQNAGC